MREHLFKQHLAVKLKYYCTLQRDTVNIIDRKDNVHAED